MSPEAGGVLDRVGFAREANRVDPIARAFERTGEIVTHGRRSEENAGADLLGLEPPSAAHRPPETCGCSRQPEARAPPSADQASASRSTGRRSAVGCVAVVEHEVVAVWVREERHVA